MKILFDYSIFFHQKYGGISRYFLNLQEQFLKKNIDIRIFAPIHQNIFLKNNRNNNLFNIYLKNYPLLTRKIFKTFNHFSSKIYYNIYRPEIIHKTFYEKNINKNKCKRVITVYDLIHEIYYKDYNKPNNFKPKKKAFDYIDKIICISNNTKKDLLNFYDVDEKKVEVIHLGVQKFHDYEKKNIIEYKKPFLLYVGDRLRYKNFFNFIKAYSTSTKLQKDFDIVCSGGGDITNLEKNLILNLNVDIKKIKQIEANDDQLSYLYKNASAFIYPSKYEGFGLPTLEDMSLGCPVISSKHSAIIETVGDAAKTFNSEDYEDIKFCIEKVVYSKQEIESLRLKGFKRVKMFSWEDCAEKTLNVYKKII